MATVLAHARLLSSFLEHPCAPCALQTLYSGTLPVVTFQTVNLTIPTAVPKPPSTLNLQKDHATYNHFQYCQGHKPLALIWHRLKTILSHPYWSHHSQSVDAMAPFSFLRLLSCSFIYTGILGSTPGGGISRIPTVSHVSAYAQGSLQHSHWKNHNRSNMFSENTFTPTVILLIFVCSVLEEDASTKFAEFAI